MLHIGRTGRRNAAWRGRRHSFSYLEFAAMLIDESRAPLMFLRSQGESDTPVEQQLQRLLDQGQPLSLIHI